MTLEETNKQYLLNGMETALCLCSQKVLPNSPIYGKEFHLLGNGIYIGNFIDSLWLDHTIPKYDSCYAYYKTFDAHCTACQICIYSSYYRNMHQTEEMELLRYAFQSPQNLNHLKNIGLNAVCFRSVHNLIQSLITAEQPRLFQLHKILYKLLNKSIDRYFRSEFVGRSFDYKLQIKLIEELSALNLPADYCTEDWYKKTDSYF